MASFSGGPTYCETPDFSALYAGTVGFPVEPFNTISNGVIVLFGLAALYHVVRRAPRTVDLYILAGLLIFTGIGSGMWHGFRDGVWLRWEVQSGLLFLFAMVFCWARRLWTLAGAAIVLPAFYFGFEYSRDLFAYGVFGMSGRWVAITPLVLGTGAVMVTQTYFRDRQAALTGSLALVSALVAVTFRTIDGFESVCAQFPIGTHFLWHSFLSCGGFLGVLTLIRLPSARLLPRAPRPAVEAAE